MDFSPSEDHQAFAGLAAQILTASANHDRVRSDCLSGARVDTTVLDPKRGEGRKQRWGLVLYFITPSA